MDDLETFLKSRKESKSSVYFVLSGIVISGIIKDFGGGGIILSDVSISGEKFVGTTTIPGKNFLAWGDARKYT